MYLSRPDYSRRRVKTLSEGYRALRHMKGTKPGRPLALLVELVDLDIAQSYLSDDDYITWMLCGICSYTEAEAAEVLGVNQSTVSRRYARALVDMQAIMNNDEE